MKDKLSGNGIDVAFFALSDKAYPKQNAVSAACKFPVLTDTSAADVSSLLAVPGKEYVYVWDKQAKLVSFFAPWEIGLSNGANVAKLEALLTSLAKAP